jgi:MoaA/NifB/PqqE/SkfB family radical SAM enzyme
MCTNGFLINDKVAHKVAESGLNVIIISLDGMSKNTHDFIRGVSGCYEGVMRAIDYLDKIRGDLSIGIQTIILEKNLDEIVKIVEWVNKDKRIGFVNFQAIACPFDMVFDENWYKKSDYAFLWPQDPKKINDVINELIELKKNGAKISNSISQLEVFRRYFESPNAFIKKNICNVNSWININQFGDVYMCRLKEPIGNIKENSPNDIWYSGTANLRREEMKNCAMNCHLLVNCCCKEE